MMTMIDELKLFKGLHSKYNRWYQTGAATLRSYIGLWLQLHNEPLIVFVLNFVICQKYFKKLITKVNERLPLSQIHITNALNSSSVKSKKLQFLLWKVCDT